MLSSDRPGRRPKPTAMKLLLPHRSDRPINQNEPEPLLVLPEPPAFLNKYAKDEWKRIAIALNRIGIVSEVDLAGLAAYCQAYGRWLMAEEELETAELVVHGPHGSKPNPLLSIASMERKDMMRFATEFGMTPSSRSRIHANPPEDEDVGEMYFKNRQ